MELAFLPGFGSLNLFGHYLKTVPQLFHMHIPNPLAKSQRQKPPAFSFFCILDPANHCPASSRQSKCPWVYLLSLSYPSRCGGGVPLESHLYSFYPWFRMGAQHYPLPKPLNYSWAGPRTPFWQHKKTLLRVLAQWFSTKAILPLRRHSATSGEIFGCHTSVCVGVGAASSI